MPDKTDQPHMTRKEKIAAGLVQGKGKPRKFPTEQALQSAFFNYIAKCEAESPKRIPTRQGFSVFCDMTMESYYQQKLYYSDTFDKIELAFLDQTVNSDPKRVAMAIFALKNTEGWTDRVQTDTNVNMVVASVTDEELERRLAACGYVKQIEEK